MTSLADGLPPAARGRRSSASRAVAAVNEAFGLTMSPSPLISLSASSNTSLAPSGTAPPKIVRRPCAVTAAPSTTQEGDQREIGEDDNTQEGVSPTTNVEEVPAIVDQHAAPTKLAALAARYKDLEPKPKPVCHLARLSPELLTAVATFVSNDLKGIAAFSTVNMRCRVACLPVVTTIELIPTLTTIEALSKEGAGHSLARFLAARGQHVQRFSVVNSSHVYGLPNTVIGPQLNVPDLSRAVFTMQKLKSLDLRGITTRGFVPWSDHFLADLPKFCPQLQSLKVGVQFIKSWEPQWWQPLTQLKEFVVGSRREDRDWADPAPAWGANPVPVPIHDDFFVMLRTLPQIQTVKLWCPISQQALTQLATPAQPFPSLGHLSFNVAGNTATFKPVDDPPKEDAPPAKEAPAKKDPKAKASKAAQEEPPPQAKIMFPALQSVTVVDLKDRPELASELLARYAVIAPMLQNVNFANTMRNAPGRAQPPQGRGRR